MATKTAQSKVFAKAKKAATRQWKSSRKKEATVAGGQQLPGGIVGGIAVLVGKEWKETEKAPITPYLVLEFSVAEPEEHEGVKQKLSYFFADTKYRSIQETTDRLSSDVQLMGVTDTEDMDLEDLDAALDELVKEEQAIKFNTRDGETDDKKKWFKFDIAGVADDYEPPDDEEPEPDEDDADDEDEEEPEPDEDEEEEEADDDDEPDEDEEEPEPDEDDEDEWVPEKGEVYNYKPPKSRKAVEVEILSVNTKKETVTGKNLADGKRYKDVPWDKLTGE